MTFSAILQLNCDKSVSNGGGNQEPGANPGVQLDTSPIAPGYRKLFRAIRIFAFVARLAIRKD